MIGSFFLLNLFTGTIFCKFNELHEEISSISKFLTDDQIRWIKIQKFIYKANPKFRELKIPTNSIRRIVFYIVHSVKFETTIMICILINALMMALTYETSPILFKQIIEGINNIFSAFFFIEMLMKIFSLGIQTYWKSNWNKFDAFIVLTSIFDFLMQLLGNSLSKFYKIGPQLMRVMRVIRISRLFKLIKKLEGLQKQLQIIILIIPTLINIGCLLFLIFFIFAIMGCFLFKNIENGKNINENNNFRNFSNSFLILFRCATGEDWYKIMFDTMNSPEGTSFIILCFFS